MMAALKVSTHFAVTPKPASMYVNSTKNNFVAINSRRIFRCNCIIKANKISNYTTPWLMLPPTVDEETGEKLDCFYSLDDNHTLLLPRKSTLNVPDSAKCFGSAMSWLAFVDPNDCSVYLSNPFINDVVHLPSLEKLPSVLGVQRDPGSDLILNFKIRLQNSEIVWGTNDVDPFTMCKPEHMSWHISNLARSDAGPRTLDSVVMVIQGHDCQGRLAYCPISRRFTDETDFDVIPGKQGCGDTWLGLQEDYYPGLPYNQVVYSNKTKLFYALFENTGLQGFDVHRDRGQRSRLVCEYPWKELERDLNNAMNDFESDEILMNLRSTCRKKHYLVTLENGDLLLIVRYYKYLGYPHVASPVPRQTLHFDVFRIGFPSSVERLITIGNRAVFIGRNQSFCLKGCESSVIRPDCIYFTDDIGSINVHAPDWGHDIGIFSMEDDSIDPCYPYEDAENEKKVPMSSALFWVAPPLAFGPLSGVLDPTLEYIETCKLG